MSKKNQKVAMTAEEQLAQEVNAVVANNETAEKAQLDPVAQAKKEAQELMERAKEAAKRAKEAAAEAKKAAQAAKAFTSRPKRMSTWTIQDETGSELTKSDVHYVAEKYGIDYIAAQREAGNHEVEVHLCKVSKETKEAVLISRIYLNEEGQIVID